MADIQTQSMSYRAESFIKLVREFTGADPAIIHAESLVSQHASDATRQFLAEGERMDGLFCLTDGLAQGAYHALKNAGLRIPDDVAVVGIGDYEASPFYDPPLTSIGAPPDVICNAVSDLLRDQLEDASTPPRFIELPPSVQLRESTNRRPSGRHKSPRKAFFPANWNRAVATASRPAHLTRIFPH
jgi:LacI family transcriptional regulator